MFTELIAMKQSSLILPVAMVHCLIKTMQMINDYLLINVFQASVSH